MTIPIIGLTGGIASGKSTVSEYFKKRGITVVDADKIAREAVAPNTPCLEKIKTYFGPQIILDNGELNRAELRKLIFTNEVKKQWLNDLLHPVIRQQILKQLNEANGPYTILDAPLLFENSLDKICDKTIVVDVPENIQITRALKRDNSDASLIKNIIASQMNRESKIASADFVIDNSQSLEITNMQVERLHKILSSRI